MFALMGKMISMPRGESKVCDDFQDRVYCYSYALENVSVICNKVNNYVVCMSKKKFSEEGL